MAGWQHLGLQTFSLRQRRHLPPGAGFGTGVVAGVQNSWRSCCEATTPTFRPPSTNSWKPSEEDRQCLEGWNWNPYRRQRPRPPMSREEWRGKFPGKGWEKEMLRIWESGGMTKLYVYLTQNYGISPFWRKRKELNQHRIWIFSPVAAIPRKKANSTYTEFFLAPCMNKHRIFVLTRKEN